MSNFGPRTTHVTPISDTLEFRDTSEPPHPQQRPPLKALRVADSDLIVPKAWLIGSDIAGWAADLGGRVRWVRQDWSAHLLERCDNGDIDIAVFNTDIAQQYQADYPDHHLHVCKPFARSMGGRNFNMIVAADNPLLGMTADQLRNNLSDVNIYVGRDTDRYRNLLLVLGVEDDSWWTDRHIRIVNIADPPLDTLLTDHDAILVPGQNLRYEAQVSGGYDELLSYESLGKAICEELRKRAQNSLVFGGGFDGAYGDPDQVNSALAARFRRNTSSDEFTEGLIDTLVDECEFATSSRTDRQRVARHVLYETYQVGDPEW